MLPNIRMYVVRFHVSRQSRPTFGAPALSILSAPSAPTRSWRSHNSCRVWGWLVRLQQRRGDTVFFLGWWGTASVLTLLLVLQSHPFWIPHLSVSLMKLSIKPPHFLLGLLELFAQLLNLELPLLYRFLASSNWSSRLCFMLGHWVGTGKRLGLMIVIAFRFWFWFRVRDNYKLES